MQNSLQPTYYFDCDHPDIRNAVKSITGECKNQVEALQRLFLFVRDQIPYNMYAVTGNQKYYKASKIKEIGYGYCVQKAILFLWQISHPLQVWKVSVWLTSTYQALLI